MQQLVQEDDNQGGDDELNDQEETDTSTEFSRLAIEAGENSDGSMTKGDDKSKNYGILSSVFFSSFARKVGGGAYVSAHRQTKHGLPSS